MRYGRFWLTKANNSKAPTIVTIIGEWNCTCNFFKDSIKWRWRRDEYQWNRHHTNKSSTPTTKMSPITKEIASFVVIISNLRQPKASAEHRRGELQDNTFQDHFKFFLSETSNQIIFWVVKRWLRYCLFHVHK